MSKENDTKINIMDLRTEASFKGIPFGKAHNPIIPKGEQNELMNLQVHNGKDDWVACGDVEIGTDGFLEIMFILNNQIVKIKRFPDKDAFIFTFGVAKTDNNKTDNTSEENK